MRLPKSIGRYRVERELGKGAMGRVLLCHDPVLQRSVALKHLRTDLAIAPEQKGPLIERMRQEARASARVSHPNLVSLHDMGEDPHLGLFLVFEYIEGPTLKARVKQGPLPASRAATLARELGSGMRYAHDAGVLHRDIKPDNVILSKTGAKLADFGIARIPDSTLTQGGSILGTPAYSAPEAIGDGKFSPRSDQFSLAATLYEAISGRRAFPGDDAVSVATLIANEEPKPIAAACGLELNVDRVLFRALSKKPSERYNDCEQFGIALSEALHPGGRKQMVTLPDAHHLAQQNPAPGFGQGRSSLSLVLAAAVFGALGIWLGARVINPKPAPAQSSVVADVEDEAEPVAWLAERPSRQEESSNKENRNSSKPPKPAPSTKPPTGRDTSARAEGQSASGDSSGDKPTKEAPAAPGESRSPLRDRERPKR